MCLVRKMQVVSNFSISAEQSVCILYANGSERLVEAFAGDLNMYSLSK